MSTQTAAPLLPSALRLEETSDSGPDEEDGASDLTEAFEAHAAALEMDDVEQGNKVGIRDALRSIIQVATPFFREGGPRCWGLAICNLVFLLMETLMLIRISAVHKEIVDALVARQSARFWAYEKSFLGWILLLVLAVFLNKYAAGAFSLEWRRFLSDRLLRSYLSESQAYYRLKMHRADIDNPDQRIGQDVGSFTSSVVSFITELTKAILTILSMSGVLYMVSRNLFAAVILGSALVSGISVGVFGGPLMRMQRTILGREANLRFALVRVREHAESIAFYRGADFERVRSMDFLLRVIEVSYRRLFVSTAFHGFQTSVTAFLHFLPWLLMSEEFFEGKVQVGDIGQAAMLFNHLMYSLTLLASQLEAISSLGAQAVRVRQLQEGLSEGKRLRDSCCSPADEEHWEVEAPRPMSIELQEMPPAAARDRAAAPAGRSRQGGNVELQAMPSAPARAGQGGASGSSSGGGAAPAMHDICLRLNGITLLPPRGSDPLVSGLSLVLRDGQALMIAGPSGAGKSSILRAIGGLWSAGHGTIERCNMQDCFFAPQTPYLCMGTLRDNIAYPHSAGLGPSPESDDLIKRALRGVSVDYLAERHGLDNVVNWDDVLSGGEKQRVGFARLLLRRGVRLALLDEATSAMDVENEDRAYEALRDHVSCFASVGHRPNLDKFHTHKLALRPRKVGGCEGELQEL
uniref:ABC transporter domain-containing protein n=1 Tax=Alexandrium monilatum TaxID=311494 RepID=A0A7S4QG67_9DINO|mmetsp:Transcript_14903/g.47642  ORF Transcript_14903/g.47642 Transcript_14903/m.47642 type:complete len:691 (-) Transcript_14903:46-2118(-)